MPLLKANAKITSETNFLNGQVLLFNKPIGWSSFDVVKSVRNAIKYSQKIEKIKVGHAGTLDPLAEGLLIICTGKLTKRIQEIQNQKKVYAGEITLGSTTPSYDKETEIDKKFTTSHISNELIYSACEQFKGEIMQRPPIFSAIKKEGKRLYEYARSGEIIIPDSRKVEIYDFIITDIEMPKIRFQISCSKGTYVRSLAHDYGLALKNGGHLSGLKRLKIGEYKLSDAFTVEDFKKSLLN